MIKNIRKEEIERVEILYIKGKYQYKKSYSTLTRGKHQILFSGPLPHLQPILEDIMKSVRTPLNRISTESRKKLKDLEKNATNSKSFENQGITHIIIYKCLEIS